MIHEHLDVGRCVELAYRHSTLGSGKAISCSGLIKIKGGKIIYMDNNSGHYKPESANLYNRLFKESKVHILPNIKVLADAGYRGLQKIHENVALPNRKTKKNLLTKEKKKKNRELASQRVVVENVIGLLKTLLDY